MFIDRVFLTPYMLNQFSWSLVQIKGKGLLLLSSCEQPALSLDITEKSLIRRAIARDA